MDTNYRRYRPSFFFPIALITVGVVWLLVNSGMIAVDNIYRLLPLWPVLLIAGGVSLLLRRLWWPLAGLMWALLAVLVVWALVAVPAVLPRVASAQLNHQMLSEPLGTAKSASVNLDLSIYSTQIHALKGGNDLIAADLYVIDRANLDVSGNEVKNVRLSTGPGSFNFWNFNWFEVSNKGWDIGLTPQVPLQLEVNSSTGSLNMDLTGLKIESLNIDGSTGSMTLQLPAGQKNFPFRLNGSTGSVTIRVPQDTGFDLQANGGTGSMTIDVPETAGAQVVVTSGGLGSLNLPDSYEKISGAKNEKEGTYQNKAYDTAKNPIRIRLDIGTGSVTIR